MALTQDNKISFAKQVRMFRRAITLLRDPEAVKLQQSFFAGHVDDLLSVNVSITEFSPFAVLSSEAASSDVSAKRGSKDAHRFSAESHFRESSHYGASTHSPNSFIAPGKRTIREQAAASKAKHVDISPFYFSESSNQETAPTDKRHTGHRDNKQNQQPVASGLHNAADLQGVDEAQTLAKAHNFADQLVPLTGSGQLVNTIQLIDELADVLLIAGEATHTRKASHTRRTSLEVLPPAAPTMREGTSKSEGIERTDLPASASPAGVTEQTTVHANKSGERVTEGVTTPDRDTQINRHPQSTLNFSMARINTLADELMQQQKQSLSSQIHPGIGRHLAQQVSQYSNQLSTQPAPQPASQPSARQSNPNVSGDLRREQALESEMHDQNVIELHSRNVADYNKSVVPLSGTQPPVNRDINALEQMINNVPDIDKETITRLVNEVLIEQARRHGVDLS